jgi:hypothetical protein
MGEISYKKYYLLILGLLAVMIGCSFHKNPCTSVDPIVPRLEEELFLGNIDLSMQDSYDYSFIPCTRDKYEVILQPTYAVKDTIWLFIEMFSDEDGPVLTNYFHFSKDGNVNITNENYPRLNFIPITFMLSFGSKAATVDTIRHYENDTIFSTKILPLAWAEGKDTRKFKAKKGHHYALRIYAIDFKKECEPQIIRCDLRKCD